MDPSLTIRGLAPRVGPAAPALGLGPVVPGRVVLAGLVGPVVPDLGDRARTRDPVDPADRHPVDRPVLDRVALPGIKGRVDPAALDLVDRVGLTDTKRLVDRVALAGNKGRVDRRVNRVGRRAARGARVGRLSHTRPEVFSIGLARTWAAPGTPRTASACLATARHRHPRSTGGPGITGLRPAGRRLSGTDRRPLVAGTVHRLRVVGTADGMDRRAI